MRGFIIFLIFTFCSLSSLSQDLIITSYGDTINCKITDVKNDDIFYLFKSGKKIISTSLHLAGTTKYVYNYFQEAEVPENWKPGKKDFSYDREYSIVQISFDAGLSSSLARLADGIPDNLRSYYVNLQSGFNIGGGITLYLDKNFGIGFKYNSFMTSNKTDNVTLQDPFGRTQSGTLSDDLKVSFYGPALMVRTVGASYMYTNWYAGYIKYRNVCKVGQTYYINGGNLGIGLDAGYDVKITDNILIGFQGSLMVGALSKIQVTCGNTIETVELKKGEYESLCRVDLSVGIRFKY